MPRHDDVPQNARPLQEREARKAMLASPSMEERDVLTAIWFQVTTVDQLAWTVTATEPLDVKPATLVYFGFFSFFFIGNHFNG